MAAGKGNVPAYGAAHNSDDGHEINGGRVHGAHHRFPHRRIGGNSHIECQKNHDAAGESRELIHHLPRFFHGKHDNRNGGADDGPHLGIYAEEHIQTQAGTGHIADVKGQTASYNEKGHQVPQPWENHVCNILSPFAGNTDNAPYIHLGDHVQDDGKENNKAEAGSQLLGKYGGLCQKARSDGGCSHQKGCAQKHFPLCRFLVSHKDSPPSGKHCPKTAAVHIKLSFYEQ